MTRPRAKTRKPKPKAPTAAPRAKSVRITSGGRAPLTAHEAKARRAKVRRAPRGKSRSPTPLDARSAAARLKKARARAAVAWAEATRVHVCRASDIDEGAPPPTQAPSKSTKVRGSKGDDVRELWRAYIATRGKKHAERAPLRSALVAAGVTERQVNVADLITMRYAVNSPKARDLELKVLASIERLARNAKRREQRKARKASAESKESAEGVELKHIFTTGHANPVFADEVDAPRFEPIEGSGSSTQTNKVLQDLYEGRLLREVRDGVDIDVGSAKHPPLVPWTTRTADKAEDEVHRAFAALEKAETNAARVRRTIDALEKETTISQAKRASDDADADRDAKSAAGAA